MNRFLRRIGILLGLVALIAIVRFPFTYLPSRIISFVETQGRALGLGVQIEKLDLQLPSSANFSNLKFSLPLGTSQSTFLVDSGEILLHPLAWFTFKNSASAVLHVYDGEIRGDTAAGFFGGEKTFHLVGSDLNLAKLKFRSQISLTGKLKFLLDSVLSSDPQGNVVPESGSLRVTMSDVNYSGGHALGELVGLFGTPASALGFAATILLPPVSNIVLSTSATISPAASNSGRVSPKSSNPNPPGLDRFLQINSFDLSSSLGTARGTGRLRLTTLSKIDGIDSEIVIRLSNDGWKAVGAYLALAVGVSSETPIYQWNITIHTTGGRQPNLFDHSLVIQPVRSETPTPLPSPTLPQQNAVNSALPSNTVPPANTPINMPGRKATLKRLGAVTEPDPNSESIPATDAVQ